MGRKSQIWISLGSRFIFQVHFASCHTIRADCCPCIKKQIFLGILFFKELFCVLLACADTFQAAELCGSQQVCCPELKGRNRKIWPKFCCSESHANCRDLCSLVGLAHLLHTSLQENLRTQILMEYQGSTACTSQMGSYHKG